MIHEGRRTLTVSARAAGGLADQSLSIGEKKKKKQGNFKPRRAKNRPRTSAYKKENLRNNQGGKPKHYFQEGKKEKSTFESPPRKKQREMRKGKPEGRENTRCLGDNDERCKGRRAPKKVRP